VKNKKELKRRKKKKKKKLRITVTVEKSIGPILLAEEVEGLKRRRKKTQI
jgi:hypothetical protein